MATSQQIETEIVEWAQCNHPESYPNFYSAWECFKDALFKDEVSLPSGVVKEVTRFTRDGSQQEDPIYFSVVFTANDEYFKVDGYYDGWNGEPEDLPEVEKISNPSL